MSRDARDNRIDCGTHGKRPWHFEIICKNCYRVFRLRREGDSDLDGPFIEPNTPYTQKDGVCTCDCGAILFNHDENGIVGLVCHDCFRDELRAAKLAHVDINDPQQCEKRRETALGRN